MTWFLRITPLGEPADSGENAAGYRTASFDVLVVQEKSLTTLSDLGGILEDAAVGVIGTSIFFTSGAAVPRTPAIVLKDAGGFADTFVQDTTARRQQRIIVRVVASASTQRAAQLLAWKAYHALEVVRNVNL